MKFPIRRWLKVAAIAVLVAFASSTNLACSPDPAGDRSQVNASDTPVLLVSNSGSSGIERFDLSSGESLGSFVAPDSGGLTYPDDITADPRGFESLNLR